MGVSRHEVSLFNLRHRVFSGGLYVEADYTFPAHCFVCVYLFSFAVIPGSALSSTFARTALLMDLTLSFWLFATLKP